MRYKAFSLLTGSLPEGLGAAELEGVGLDQVGIELVLVDELAETTGLWGHHSLSLPLTGWAGNFFDSREDGTGSARRDFLDRADADAVCLAQSRLTARVSATRISAAWTRETHWRDGIAIAYESFTCGRLENLSSEL
jgi:hypothetical protein